MRMVEVMKTIAGVSVIIIDPLIADVRLTPLKKASILMPTPKRAQRKILPPSFFQLTVDFMPRLINQKRIVAMATRATIKPKGLMYSGVTVFTTL